MNTKKIKCLAWILLVFTLDSFAQSITYGSNPEAGHYLNVGDAKIYYEVYGEGRPLLLLHGGLYGYIDEFGQYIPELSKHFKVIAIATRGHGRSEVGNKPFSYRLFADDAAKILRKESSDSAIVIGFSDGATTAYVLAADHPETICRMVALAGGVNSSGYKPGSIERMQKMKPEDVEKNYPDFVNDRKKIMPQPEVWNEFVAKLKTAWLENVYVSQEKSKAIKSSILIIAGDRDEFRTLEQFVEIYQTIPHSQLAIIPNCNHVGPIEKPMIFNDIILPFVLQ